MCLLEHIFFNIFFQIFVYITSVFTPMLYIIDILYRSDLNRWWTGIICLLEPVLYVFSTLECRCNSRHDNHYRESKPWKLKYINFTSYVNFYDTMVVEVATRVMLVSAYFYNIKEYATLRKYISKRCRNSFFIIKLNISYWQSSNIEIELKFELTHKST